MARRRGETPCAHWVNQVRNHVIHSTIHTSIQPYNHIYIQPYTHTTSQPYNHTYNHTYITNANINFISLLHTYQGVCKHYRNPLRSRCTFSHDIRFLLNPCEAVRAVIDIEVKRGLGIALQEKRDGRRSGTRGMLSSFKKTSSQKVRSAFCTCSESRRE